jgi:hypothetical protein
MYAKTQLAAPPKSDSTFPINCCSFSLSIVGVFEDEDDDDDVVLIYCQVSGSNATIISNPSNIQSCG